MRELTCKMGIREDPIRKISEITVEVVEQNIMCFSVEVERRRSIMKYIIR